MREENLDSVDENGERQHSKQVHGRESDKHRCGEHPHGERERGEVNCLAHVGLLRLRARELKRVPCCSVLTEMDRESQPKGWGYGFAEVCNSTTDIKGQGCEEVKITVQ